ncbi:MAG: RsmB/NOP family class I SAM-dependent RNA methyltransferase [Chlamydiia bacterium]
MEHALTSRSEAFRQYHLLRFLDGYDPQRGPLDLAFRAYTKRYAQLGSKDRAWLASRVVLHEKIRGTLDALVGDNLEDRAEILQGEWQREAQGLSPGLQRACPEWLWSRLAAQYGEERTHELATVFMEEAPLYLRANLAKTTRAQLMQRLSALEGLEACPEQIAALRLPVRTYVTQLDAYQEGHFEIQDLASQLVAERVRAQPGETVLDFCAGAGGKSLAIAPALAGTGQLYLHDIRPQALLQAKARLKRAGIQNAQEVQPESRPLRLLKHRCDWVLVDAPCSGTGTLRRNPEMKWRLHEADVERLCLLQREILEQASAYVKPNGRLVYATCSILESENQHQVSWLKSQGWSCLEEWSSLPISGGMDGLYVAVLARSERSSS